jgi:ATP-binding cassette subfamily C (CFTR/MRP) protein 4
MLCGMLQRGIRQTAETMAQMTSVERILQFTRLEQEENYEVTNLEGKLPCDWPKQGKIEFKEFYLRYAKDKDPILKNVNVVIKPGSKVRKISAL